MINTDRLADVRYACVRCGLGLSVVVLFFSFLPVDKRRIGIPFGETGLMGTHNSFSYEDKTGTVLPFRVSNYLTINHKLMMILLSTALVFLGDSLVRQFLDRQNWDTLLVPKDSNMKRNSSRWCVVVLGR